MAQTFIPDSDFQQEAEAPEKRLTLEFKQALDLKSAEGKAALAKEICALSNHGGGFIVFGRTDDGGYVDSLHDSLNGITQDDVNSIACAYLIPAPQCTLRWISIDQASFKLPVLWAPGIDTTPVCTKKGGPQDSKGRPQNIQNATHYTRIAGPQSVPITLPEQWGPILKRCVSQSRTELMADISALLSDPTGVPSDTGTALDNEQEHMLSVWREQISQLPNASDLLENYICFGFELIRAHDEPQITTGQIADIVSQNTRDGDWRTEFFEQSENVHAHVMEVEGRDGLEAYLMINDMGRPAQPPLIWRISEAGVGTALHGYIEDTDVMAGIVMRYGRQTWHPRENLSLRNQIISIDRFIGRAEAFANAVGFQGAMRIRLTYMGLAGRHLNDPDPLMLGARWAYQQTKSEGFHSGF